MGAAHPGAGLMRVLLWAVLTTLAWPVMAEQVLRRGGGPSVETLDPHKAEGVSTSDVLRDLYEGLTNTGPKGAPVPGAAERWSISEDGLRYRFELRRDARWSNGDAVTAADFVAGLQRSADPATGSNYSKILAPIGNAEAVIRGELPPSALAVRALDDQTLEIELNAPTPYFLGQLAHSSSYPIHRPSLAQWGDGFARPGRLVGNGAYVLNEWVLQSHIELRRNPQYWANARTRIDRVIYVTTEDINSEYKRYRAGELDWTYTLPSTQVGWLRENLPDELQIHPYLGIYYFGFNTTQPPFRDNPKLRMALTLAVDREVITEKVLGSGEVPATGWIPPGVIHHRAATAPWVGMSREERLALARQLYAEAGYSERNPASVEILYNTQEDHRKVATVIAAMWKQWLGVDAKLRNQEWKVYLQTRRLKQHTQVFRAGWIGDYNDPHTFMEIKHSRHGLNDEGYNSPRFDALLDAARAEPDLERRAELMYQAETVLLEDLPVLPIYFYVTKRLVKPWVKGWSGNILDHHRSHSMYIEGRP
jgi:oligopeptide transport system substrate-binding protein